MAAQGNGDHHPLTHTAGELVGILVESLFRHGDADQFQHFNRMLLGLMLVHARMNFQGLHDLLSNGKNRVERGHGLLEDHGDFAAANLSHFIFALFQQVLPFKEDLAAYDFSRRRLNQLHDRQ